MEGGGEFISPIQLLLFWVSTAPRLAVLSPTSDQALSPQDGDMGGDNHLICAPTGTITRWQPVWPNQHPVAWFTAEIPLASDWTVIFTCKQETESYQWLVSSFRTQLHQLQQYLLRKKETQYNVRRNNLVKQLDHTKTKILLIHRAKIQQKASYNCIWINASNHLPSCCDKSRRWLLLATLKKRRWRLYRGSLAEVKESPLCCTGNIVSLVACSTLS